MEGVYSNISANENKKNDEDKRKIVTLMALADVRTQILLLEEDLKKEFIFLYLMKKEDYNYLI